MRLGYKTKKIAAGVIMLVFVVGILQPISTPIAQAEIGSATAAGAGAAGAGTTATDLGCSNPNTWTQCLAYMVYWIGPGIASYVASIAAYFFDFMVQISLNSSAYALTFIQQSWEVVRDLANMAFIFILIFIAFTIMLEAETDSTKKMLVAVVVVALLVNFSFFLTRVVIDMGNILAVQFYNSIQVAGPPINGIKDLSAGIMNAAQLQNLLASPTFDAAQKAAEGSAFGGLIVISLIYLAVAAMLWILAFAFLHVGVKFLMRVVGLWLVIIASPLAFVSRTVPKLQPFFERWLEYLIKFTFYPAIFLFMFLILSKLVEQMGSGNLSNAIFNSISAPGGGAANPAAITQAIAAVVVRMGFIVAMLYAGLKAADYIVEEGNKFAYGLRRGIFRYGGQFVAGTVGFVGRETLGRGFNRLGQSPTFNRAVDFAERYKGRVPGLGLVVATDRAAKRLATGSYDIRSAPGAGLLKDVAGVDLGKPKGEGGIAKSIKEKGERLEKEQQARAAIIRDASNREAIKRIAAGRGTPEDVDRVRNFNKREWEGLKSAEIESVAHLMKESQLKNVEGSDKFSDREKEGIRTIADPIVKSQKIVVEELRKLNSQLRTVTAPVVQTNTAKSSTVNDASARAMLVDVNTQMTTVRGRIAAAAPGADNTELQKDLDQLQNAKNSINELRKNLRDVVPHAGRSANEIVAN